MNAIDTSEGYEIEGKMVAETGLVALLNKSEIDQQIATAHRFPRSLTRFREESLQMVTLTEQIAQECIYSLPRDGKTIEGPSARFSEVVASAWGNCRAGARVMNDQGEFVTAQGVFHDLEKNVAITYEVQRRITDKHGKRYKPDMVGVTANAACSIALRNAILKGVPKAFWSSIYQAARKTVMGDFKTLANRRAEAIAEFQRYGVLPEQICATLGVPGINDIGLEQLVTLRGLLTAIQEGDTTPEQAFGTDKQPVQGPQRKSSLQPAQDEADKAPDTKAETKPETKPTDPPVINNDTPAPRQPAPAADAGAPLFSETMRNIVRKRLEGTGLTEVDLNAQFGVGLDGLRAPQFNDVQTWIKERASA